MNGTPDAAQPPSVVVIDDTPDLRHLVRMALERRGDFRVVGEAGDGREGVAKATAVQPDIVLLDIAMPEMDGLQALPLIRRACPETVIIVLSGFGAPVMSGRALDTGADGYLQKGLSIRSLVEQVQIIAAGAAAQREAVRSLSDHDEPPGAGGSHPAPNASDAGSLGDDPRPPTDEGRSRMVPRRRPRRPHWWLAIPVVQLVH